MTANIYMVNMMKYCIYTMDSSIILNNEAGVTSIISPRQAACNADNMCLLYVPPICGGTLYQWTTHELH